MSDYASVPENTVLLNPDKGSEQLPEYVDIDLILSQNKFGQFQIAKQISEQMSVPLISLEHTLPMESWPVSHLQNLYNMKGDINIFPLTHLPVVKDLVVDLKHAFKQLEFMGNKISSNLLPFGFLP